MKCPKCNSELNCGCNSCKQHSPGKINKMILHDADETKECPVCGFRQHIESWADEEFEQYKEKELQNLARQTKQSQKSKRG